MPRSRWPCDARARAADLRAPRARDRRNARGPIRVEQDNTHPETYPKFQTQLKKVALLRDMVNWCIINPLEGSELPENDPRMKALEAYILAQRAGQPLQAGKH